MNRIEFRTLQKNIRHKKPESILYEAFTEKQLNELYKLGYTKFMQHVTRGACLLKGDKIAEGQN